MDHELNLPNNLKKSKNPIETAFGLIELGAEIVFSPFTILKGKIPLTKEKRGKHIREIDRQEKISERKLPDADRVIAITIMPIGEYIVVKTDRRGEAIFHFDKVVLEKEIFPQNYELTFNHEKITDGVYASVHKNIFSKLLADKRRKIKKNRRLNEQSINDNTFETAEAKERITWFSKAESAASVASNLPTARKLSRLYRKYGRSFCFVRKAMRVLLIDTIIGYVVVEAFFLFVEYTLSKYGDEVE